MKGRLLVTFVVLVMAAAACAEPGLVGGDPVAQETESETGGPEEASTSEATSEASTGEESATDALKQTTSTLATPTTVQTAPRTTDATDLPPEGTVPPTAEKGTLVEKANADLAIRISISVDLIDVVRVQQVEWPDRGSGCPEPGKLYAQMISMGWEIILSYEGKTYSYHSGGGGDPFYCAKPSDPLPGSEF